MSSRILPLALLLAACSEYQINPEKDHSLGADTGFVPDTEDTEDEEDTAEPEEEDTDPDDAIDEEEPVANAPVYAHSSDMLFEVEPATGQRTQIGTFSIDGQPIEDSFIDIAIDLDGRMYGATFFGLFRINPEDASVREICAVDVDMVAMAFSSDGELFVGGADGVQIINVNNCRTTPLAVGGDYETSGDLVGLPDGYLYWTVRGDRDGLVRVDPLTGQTSWIGSTGFSRIFGLGYDDGVLYGFNDYGETIAISPSNASANILITDRSISWYGATTNPVQW